MRDFSEQTAARIDQEIQKFLREAMDRATLILSERRTQLDQIAESLLDNESIGKEEIIAIMGERAAAEVMGGTAVATSNKDDEP